MKSVRVLSKSVFNKAMGFVYATSQLPIKVHTIVVFTSLGLSKHALAAGGITGFFTGWKSAGNALIELMILGGLVIGIGAVLYGLIQMIKKGTGRGDEIEWSKILWPIIGGGLASILLYVMQAVVEEGGASKADMGRSRTGP